MTTRERRRTLDHDWFEGFIPHNAHLVAGAYLETTFSFERYRSTRPNGFIMKEGAQAYLGCMFDLGPDASIEIGSFALLHGVHVIADSRVQIGDHALISWNVVIMDTYRAPRDPSQRRLALEEVAKSPSRNHAPRHDARPVRIGHATWIGFDVSILPGVTVGDGAIVGARSTVAIDIPEYTIAAGNPARVIRPLTPEERSLA